MVKLLNLVGIKNFDGKISKWLCIIKQGPAYSRTLFYGYYSVTISTFENNPFVTAIEFPWKSTPIKLNEPKMVPPE